MPPTVERLPVSIKKCRYVHQASKHWEPKLGIPRVLHLHIWLADPELQTPGLQHLTRDFSQAAQKATAKQEPAEHVKHGLAIQNAAVVGTALKFSFLFCYGVALKEERNITQQAVCQTFGVERLDLSKMLAFS